MKGSAALIALIVIGVIVALGMLGYIFFIKTQNTSSSPSGYIESVAPSIPVKDFAPGIPMTQKTTIIIMSNDSSEEKYIVPTSQVDTYVKQLPPGYHAISKSP